MKFRLKEEQSWPNAFSIQESHSVKLLSFGTGRRWALLALLELTSILQ
jgi:hypothetical protein